VQYHQLRLNQRRYSVCPVCCHLRLPLFLHSATEVAHSARLERMSGVIRIGDIKPRLHPQKATTSRGRNAMSGLSDFQHFLLRPELRHNARLIA
jgi:hypothetical protein